MFFPSLSFRHKSISLRQSLSAENSICSANATIMEQRCDRYTQLTYIFRFNINFSSKDLAIVLAERDPQDSWKARIVFIYFSVYTT